MLTALISFFRAHWTVVAAFGVMLTILSYIGIQQLEISHYRTTLNEYKAENISLTSNNASLVAAINSQNSAIESFRKRNDELTDQRRMAIEQAQKAAAQVQALLASTATISPKADDCTNMKHLVDAFYGLKTN